MADAMNDTTRARIDGLCDKIAVAQDLDPEIRAELRGHLEDKLLAYLSGKEKISEDDAFFLVREHFGDPAKVKALLQDVHIIDADVSLARRLAAITILILFQLWIMREALAVSSRAAEWLVSHGTRDPLASTLYPVFVATALVATIGVHWAVLKRWSTRILKGDRPWFQTWSAGRILAVGVSLILVFCLAPVTTGLEKLSPGLLPPAVNATLMVIALSSVIAQAVLWLWWCDQPPRRPRTLTISAIAWLAVAIVPWKAFRQVESAVGIDASDLGGALVYLHAQDAYSLAEWMRQSIGRWSPIGVPDVLWFSIPVFIVAFAKLIYRLSQRSTLSRRLSR